jgi:hypothetical protein
LSEERGGGEGAASHRPGEERPPAPRPGARYSVVVGVLLLALIVVALVNTLGGNDEGILGASETDAGIPLAEFAVPDARGDLEGDANVFQDNCETSEHPCPEDARRPSACRVDVSGAIRVCDLFDRPLVISFWFTRFADCLPAQDVVDRVGRRYRGRVNSLLINVGDDRDEVERIIAERDWQVPIGHDPDGAVSNLYRVGGCPTVALAYPGGILQRAVISTSQLTEERFTAAVERLLSQSRRRAAADR